MPASVTAFGLVTRPGIAAQATALCVPLAAGVVAFGWRAALTAGLVLAGTFASLTVLRRCGRKGHALNFAESAWAALLLTGLLPAHLAGSGVATPAGLEPPASWPLLPAAGLLLGVAMWLLGGVVRARVSPVLVTFVAVAFVAGPHLTPHLVLRPQAAVTGDLLDYDRQPIKDLEGVPWVQRPRESGSPDAQYRTSASAVLSAYASGRDEPERGNYAVDGVLRERMPPPEDLILLGHPSAVGSASAAAVLAAGMTLLWRGVLRAGVPVGAIVSAYACFALMPLPLALTPQGPVWTWSLLLGGGVAWDVALTFVHYELLAGPILYVCVLLAALPGTQPVTVAARGTYSVLVGVSAAAAQRFLHPDVGPPAALLCVSLLTPALDAATRAVPLVRRKRGRDV